MEPTKEEIESLREKGGITRAAAVQKIRQDRLRAEQAAGQTPSQPQADATHPAATTDEAFG